jgi:hypothetical protein
MGDFNDVPEGDLDFAHWVRKYPNPLNKNVNRWRPGAHIDMNPGLKPTILGKKSKPLAYFTRLGYGCLSTLSPVTSNCSASIELIFVVDKNQTPHVKIFLFETNQYVYRSFIFSVL